METLSQITKYKTFHLLSEKLISWYETFVKSLPNLVVALLVFMLGLYIAKISQKLFGNFIKKISPNKAVGDLINNLLTMLITLTSFFVALEILHLEKTVTSLLAGAGVIGLALGFAFQEIASNFVAGIFIAFREPYQIGDIIKMGDYFGEVIKVKMRTTSIRTFQGLEAIIPNKDMFTKPFINYTTTPERRVDLEVGVSYGDDLSKVEKVVKEAIEKLEIRIKSHPVEVFFHSFGNSSIDFTLRFWVDYKQNRNYVQAKHDAVMAVKKAFDENDITIPFPIRTLDFGIKGGVPLHEDLGERDL